MKPTIVTVKGSEAVEREMTDTEYTQYQKDQTANTARQLADATAAKTLETKRQAIYTKLGLTADEIETLFG